ncbi:hypothetical protein OY671_005999 [Metschnikowia pulcherrima]|nr:hypothetical protein OY671_005999 [Metschnikowia pulcherrima]
MDPGAVVIRYDPERWAEKEEEETSPSKMVSFNYTKPAPAQSRVSMLQVPRKRHLIPLSSTSFERPIKESLENLSQYAEKRDSGQPVETVEKEWYEDLTNVAQRLKFLRDTFKVIQSVRKRKMMGERADFRTLYDTKVSRTGSPLLSDDEKLGSEDETRAQMAIPAPPVSRRGRPRKRRGRERKAPLGRAEMALRRTRVSSRLQDAPSQPSERNSGALPPQPQPPKPAVPGAKRRGRPPRVRPPPPEPEPEPKEVKLAPHSPTTEPQGPPLMHSPPILPSQRHSLVRGIPPYRHLSPVGTTPEDVTPQVPAFKDLQPKLDIQQKPAPFLPSQTELSASGHNPGSHSSAPSPSFLPSQPSLQGVVPFSFKNYQSPSGAAKPPQASSPGYVTNFAPPINYTNFTSAPFTRTVPDPASLAAPWKVTVARPPNINESKEKAAGQDTSHTAYKPHALRKPFISMNPGDSHAQTSSASIDTKLKPTPGLPAENTAVPRAPVYSKTVPSPAPASQYNTWQRPSSFGLEQTQVSEELGMTLPSLQALEADINSSQFTKDHTGEYAYEG